MGEQHAHPPVIRAAGSALPGAAQAVLAGGEIVDFIALRPLSIVPTVVAVGLFSAPALSVMALCIWVMRSLTLGWWSAVPLLVAGVCGVVMLAQVLRLRVAAQHIAQQRMRRTGKEGLYWTKQWLMVVRSPEQVSWVAKRSISHVMAVRVRFQRGDASFCTTYPCAVLADGQEMCFRLPALDTDQTVTELLEAWMGEIRPFRMDVTESQLKRFLDF